MNFGVEAFGEPADSLVKDILQLGGHRLLDDHAPLGRRLWALWPTRAAGDEVLADVVGDLRRVREDLRSAAVDRGWEMPETGDPFARLRRLEADLRGEGREDLSIQLADAVAAGATGTEILMRVKWVLSREEIRHASVTTSLAASIEAALVEVSALLLR